MDSVDVKRSKEKKKHSSSSKSESSKQKKSKHRHRERERDKSRSKSRSSSRSRSGSPTTVSKRRHRSKSSSTSSRGSPSAERKSSHRSEKNNKKHKTTEDSSNDLISGGGGGGGDSASLSIEETNKLRAKLGLKPLTLDDNQEKSASSSSVTGDNEKKLYLDKKTSQQFEHAPAKNLAEVKEQKEFKKKLEEQKEKRRLVEKLKQVKGIADDESDDDDKQSAAIWLTKLKQKEEAARKAKLLEEMDQQFESSAASTSTGKKKTTYDENHLKGFKVEHDQAHFKEGQQIILTLKDRNIIKGTGDEMDVEDEEDTLVNVNILDDERAAKNVENRKKRPDYNPYDDFDEYGNFKERGLLDKYDEELNGEKKKSFKLGAKGTYDMSDEKFIQQLNEDYKSRAIKLEIADLKVTNDYFTPEEMEKFKKPKKMRKVLRKPKLLKADDLVPLPETSENSSSTNSRSRERVKQENGNSKQSSEEPKKIVLKDIDFGFKDKDGDESDEGEIKSDDDDKPKVKKEPKSSGEDSDTDENEDDDEIDLSKLNEKDKEELKKIIDDENNAIDELQTMLSKTRKKITTQAATTSTSDNMDESFKKESTSGVDLDQLDTIRDEDDDDDDDDRAVVLDTISEFCRNIKNESEEDEKEEEFSKQPKKVPKKNNDEEKIDDDDDDDENAEVNRKKRYADESSEDDDDEKNHSDVEMTEKKEDEVNILDEEPIIDRGLMSALKLAVNKGYLAQEKEKQNARIKNTNPSNNINAINYTIEERNYYDIDDKYNRNRDKYSGPLVDFDEKRNYKPDVKLDYIDEKGHSMNEKEAFRYLSHRFHGKGPGKLKTEKRINKIKESEAMNKMSSVDTPLNTVALLVEKQKKLQQPYVVLSAKTKSKQDQHELTK